MVSGRSPFLYYRLLTLVGNSNGHLKPAVSLVNGHPDQDVDMNEDAPAPMNGDTNGKRKARTSAGKSYKETSDSDDDVPLVKRRKTAAQPARATAADLSDSDDSDAPLGEQLANKKAEIEADAEQEAKKIQAKEKKVKAAPKKKVKEESDDDSDDDKPLAKKKAPAKSTTAAKTKAKVKTETTPKKAAAKGKGKAAKVETEQDAEAEDEEEEYRWWEQEKGDGTKKWDTLEHNGVVFPPEYELLPKNVKLVYDGIPVTLKPEAEEVACMYGSMLHSTVNVENPTFNKNFFQDFSEYLDKTGHGTDKDGKKVKITKFEKCDFKPIFEYYTAEREKKKALSSAEKKELKKQKDEVEAPYMFCLWDGRKQKVGNFRVEPPGLFRGRGEHPKTGKVKKRVLPEQITINIGKEATVPAPPEGHQWKEVKHDNEGTWLAMWQENINGAYKYVMLAANSDVKGQSDHKKFEKARELKKHIARIREDYQKEMKSDMMADRQRATAIYLIDQLALRAGNEKGDDEADTVGCCSLKFEHVTLKPPSTVVFDFLGKDSIRFYQEVEVDPQVFKNLKLFKKSPKGEGDDIFDRLNTSGLNKHLSNYMPGLTAKVFRTYNASWTMARLLKELGEKGLNGSIPEKVNAYNEANRKVAILCNHKRTVGAGHAGQMEKLQNKINGLRYQEWRIKQMMLDIDPKIKKKKGAEFFDLPEDIDQEWVLEHQKALVEESREKIKKKFEKDNEKLLGEGNKKMSGKELDERLEVADDLEKKYKKENKSGKVEAEGKGPTIEKLEANLEKMRQRIETMKLQGEDKENNKEVALGTSKIVSQQHSIDNRAATNT